MDQSLSPGDEYTHAQLCAALEVWLQAQSRRTVRRHRAVRWLKRATGVLLLLAWATYASGSAFNSGNAITLDGVQTWTGLQTFSGGALVAGPLDVVRTDAVTNGTTTLQTWDHESTGAPSANFGIRHLYTLKSDTTAAQNAAAVDVLWSTATHASRKANMQFSVYDTAKRLGFYIETNGSAPMIGFLGAGAVVKQTVGAAATDAATTQTLCNNLRTALNNLGLTAP